METILIYGFIAVIIMLIFIYRRLGEIKDDSKHILGTLDDAVRNLESIEGNTGVLAEPERKAREASI